MEHSELIQEMPHIEQLPTQERLILARKRRNQQLKQWVQKEKEHNRRQKLQKSNKRNITFNESVVLLEAAARNDIDEVRRLLMKGVSPDSCNEDGLTALHQCCIDDNEAMLLLLLEYNANVNAEDSEKWTPLHAAATCGHLKLVRILIARGANPLAVNADGNMPYDICEDEQALDYIESEMAKRGVTQQLIDETRASTEKQMLVDMKRLAASGGNLEAYDPQGATPLHIAAANGYLSVVEFLLDHNVRTDVRDKDDWQPSHAAACWGHLEVLELLAQSGADLNAKNKHDETPADICEDPEIKERILELRTEQEIKRQAEAKRKVRRSQSNTRTQSVRRTSLRDKGLTARRDAVEEARFRLQAENKGLDTSEPSSINTNGNSTAAPNNSANPTNTNNPNNNSSSNPNPTNNNSSNSNTRSPVHSTYGTNNNLQDSTNLSNSYETNNRTVSPGEKFPQQQDPSLGILSSAVQIYENNQRKAPEGKASCDTDSLILENSNSNNSTNHILRGDSKENLYTTDVNGKVTVHVVVTINGNGTLADLKKQRMQIRNSSNDVTSVTSPLGSSIADNDSQIMSPTNSNNAADIVRFTGETMEEGVGYTKPKKCCVIM